jgi:hypothetical protein
VAQGEFIIQYVSWATDSDKERVRSQVGAVVKRKVGKGAGGLPGYELVSVPFRQRPTQAQVGAVVKKIEKDPAVTFAEVNSVYSAQSANQDQ